jgi:hypothetical protein
MFHSRFLEELLALSPNHQQTLSFDSLLADEAVKKLSALFTETTGLGELEEDHINVLLSPVLDTLSTIRGGLDAAHQAEFDALRIPWNDDRQMANLSLGVVLSRDFPDRGHFIDWITQKPDKIAGVVKGLMICALGNFDIKATKEEKGKETPVSLFKV